MNSLKQIGNLGTDFTLHAKISDLGFNQECVLSSAAGFAATIRQAVDPHSEVQA